MICPACQREVIQALLTSGKLVWLDAEPTPDGQYGAWFAPSATGAPQGVWRARLGGDRFGDGRALHACEGRAGEQLRLGGAA